MFGESDAPSNLEATSQREWCFPQIEEQNTPVICDDQAEETGPVEIADCPRGCQDRSDVASDHRIPTGITLA
jgi:phage baseplate assembly protein gpV